ncbi:unnamed protein product [Clonostachys rosea f. rosea IK726]|uniref:Uncharacterized protein n=1 Tax=Clonostachys rosea f. rosea IK726 TaxID=1349383 RepID=A0ACA9TJF3_BIOOC|nr:unnamed protein product [Clonostachys rosea f. rosea IK726]
MNVNCKSPHGMSIYHLQYNFMMTRIQSLSLHLPFKVEPRYGVNIYYGQLYTMLSITIEI